MNDVREVLKSTDLFCGVEKSLIDDLLRRCQRETWARKRSVAAKDVCQRFHIIISGRLQVMQINEETGRMVTLFFLAPGDVFDVVEFLTEHPCEGVFLARDDIELLSLPVKDARTWLIDHPEFNKALLPYLGKQMQGLAQLAGDLALHDTETRLAHLIMRHLDKEDPGQHKLKLINDLSHEVLAEMIGSVRAVVNRQLQHWRKKGIVTLDHGHIHVEKLEALLDRAGHIKLPPPDEH